MNKHHITVRLRKSKILLDRFEKTGCKDYWWEATEQLDNIEARKLLREPEGKPYKERYAKLRRRAQKLIPR